MQDVGYGNVNYAVGDIERLGNIVKESHKVAHELHAKGSRRRSNLMVMEGIALMAGSFEHIFNVDTGFMFWPALTAGVVTVGYHIYQGVQNIRFDNSTKKTLKLLEQDRSKIIATQEFNFEDTAAQLQKHQSRMDGRHKAARYSTLKPSLESFDKKVQKRRDRANEKNARAIKKGQAGLHQPAPLYEPMVVRSARLLKAFTDNVSDFVGGIKTQGAYAYYMDKRTKPGQDFSKKKGW